MSNQPENEMPQFETLPIEGIAELSDEELMEIVGGVIGEVYKAPTTKWSPKKSAEKSTEMSAEKSANQPGKKHSWRTPISLMDATLDFEVPSRFLHKNLVK